MAIPKQTISELQALIVQNGFADFLQCDIVSDILNHLENLEASLQALNSATAPTVQDTASTTSAV